MKVLMAGRGVVPIKVGCGGAELAMYQLARALAIAGHEVTVVADVAEQDFARVPNLEIVQLDSRAQRVASKLPGSFLGWIVQHFVANVATALRVRSLLRSGRQFDLIHLHAALAAVLVGRFATSPLVYTEHDSTPWSCRYRRWYERVLRKAIYLAVNVPAFRRVDRLATISEQLRTDVLTRWGVAAQNVMTIFNGADIDIFNPDRCGPSPVPERFGFDRYVLFVGKLTPRKAPDLLVRALAEAPDTNCVFAGDGEMRGRLEQLAAELGIADRVAFLGDVAPKDLGPLYVGADLLAIPSVSEGTPLVAFEAMACGTPVLSSRIAGLPELVHDWTTGFLVKPGDVGQLAIAIRFLTVDREALQRMGKEAQGRVRKRFLWPNVAREYLSLYHSLVSPGPRRPPAHSSHDADQPKAVELVA
jgi:glycosyltransferase involved in cell wall biosynthesis